MDTMESTKIVAAACASLLVFLGIRYFIAEPIYHGETDAPPAYVLAVEEAAPATEEAAPEVDYAALVASADAAAGEKQFGKCSACHKIVAGANAVGPSLHAVVGRDIGGEPGFSYSSTLAGLEGEWTPEKLIQFIAAPKAYAPGTKMAFAGFKDPKDSADVVAYLETLN